MKCQCHMCRHGEPSPRFVQAVTLAPDEVLALHRYLVEVGCECPSGDPRVARAEEKLDAATRDAYVEWAEHTEAEMERETDLTAWTGWPTLASEVE